MPHSRKIIITTAALSILALGVFTAAKAIKPPHAEEESGGDMSIFADYRSNPRSEEDEIREQAQIIGSSGEYKDGYFTVLILGLDLSENLADTIAAVTFDVNRKTAAVLNIPRDTASQSLYGGVHKLNASYGSGGAERTKEEVSKLTGYPFDRYAVVNYNAFKAIIDAVGGVEINVEKDMYKNTGDMIIDLKAGTQTLDGEHALMYMRYRGYAMADLDRIKAQQKLYSAVADKLAKPSTVLKLPSLAQAVLDNVVTDLSFGEMIWIGLNYSNADAEDIVYNTYPGSAEYINGASYVIPDKIQAMELINKYYNPYKYEIQNISTVDASNIQINEEKEPALVQKQQNTVPDWLR